jgi:hypothetical protein
LLSHILELLDFIVTHRSQAREQTPEYAGFDQYCDGLLRSSRIDAVWVVDHIHRDQLLPK